MNYRGDTMEETNQQDKNGMAGVENESILVSDPEGSGRPAVLVPQEGIRVYINGNEVKEKYPVTSSDELYYETEETVEAAKTQLQVDKNYMSAEITVTPEKKTTYCLVNQENQEVLYLKTKKEEVLTGNYPSREEILEELNNNGIVYGIDYETVDRLAAGEINSGEVAKGVEPEPGRDGYVEYHFKSEIEEIQYESNGSKVDFRERYQIPQVEKGENIADIHPPVEGTPGKNIKGEELPPPPVKEASFKCSDGTEQVEDRVIATREGRPFVSQSKTPVISVEPMYIHQGDVDMKSGNIRFNGHVKVEGGISEGMTINADGDVEVQNNVAGAYVIAGGNVSFMRNCINCQVQAGGLHLLCIDLKEHIESLNTMIEASISAADQLIEALREKGFQVEDKFAYYLQNLLKSKFPEIPDTLNEVRSILDNSQFSPPSSVLERIEEAENFFLKEGLKKVEDSSPLKKVKEGIYEALEALNSIALEPSNIEVYYVQNSTLKCSGDIIVNGPGAYNSHFECGGKVIVHKLLRGGDVIAGDDIEVGEAGSPGSTLSQGSVQVPQDKSIKFNKVHEGTKIIIGEKIMRFDDTVSNVKAKLDREEDRIKLTY